MDAGYDALEAAASSYAKAERDDDGRSHSSHHREHRHGDRDREERDDRHRDRDRERRHRDRDGRDDRDDRHRDHRERDRGGRERDYDRDREYDRRDSHRDRDYGRDDDRYRRGPPPPRRRDDMPPDFMAEPMGGGARRGPPRYDEEPYAAPMRGYGGGGDRYGGRRDDRNGGDWRPPRDDYRGGRGRDRDRDRDQRGRRGGVSPGRSPTPPGTIPLEERKVDPTLWDMAPAQFDGVGAMEAKMTGLFTYGPGRIPPPAHLGVPSTMIAGSFPPGNVGGVSVVRQSKRLYIGGVPESMTEDQLKEFFNKLMAEHKFAVDMPGEPVAQAQINHEKSFAFIELRTADEATSAMALDGTMYEGTPLRVKRPKDYVGIDPSLGPIGGMAIPDTPNKLFVGGLPTYLNDEQVMELLKSFGELRSFNLVKEGTAQGGVSKGFAFCEYLDPNVTDMAIQGLHNFQLGDRTLVVQRAAVGRNTGVQAAVPGSAGYMANNMSHILQSANGTGDIDSRCMLLLNMVTADELYDDQDYKEILEDISDECGKYGEVEGVRVPRPTPKSKKWEPSDSAAATAEKNRKADEEAGVGRVYVMYKEKEMTQKAMKAIGGRQFAGRTILVASVPEDEFLGPAPPPPPPEDLDNAAADAVKDIMSGLE